jgi:two-component system response regulator HydG
VPEPDRHRRPAPIDERQTGVAIDGLLGRSQVMLELKVLVARVAAASSPVLIVGETGTGKDRVAHAIHRTSDRRAAAFVAVTCGSLSEASLDSELFGQTAGAVPGALEARRGMFVEADGGTLFLDEVGDMPPLLQTKILRVLQTGELRAVGSETTRRVDVRCVASTRADLNALVERGRFREDLFFRLNVVPLRVPALRERPEDLALLVEHFLGRFGPRAGKTLVSTLTPRALKLLETLPWPGNVRELGNLIERLIVTTSGATIDVDAVRAALGPVAPSDPVQSLVASRVSLDALERRYIAGVLRHTQGNKARAAEILGIDLSTLYRREKHRGA